MQYGIFLCVAVISTLFSGSDAAVQCYACNYMKLTCEGDATVCGSIPATTEGSDGCRHKDYIADWAEMSCEIGCQKTDVILEVKIPGDTATVTMELAFRACSTEEITSDHCRSNQKFYDEYVVGNPDLPIASLEQMGGEVSIKDPDYEATCVCDSDLCNGGRKTALSSALMMLVLVLGKIFVI